MNIQMRFDIIVSKNDQLQAFVQFILQLKSFQQKHIVLNKTQQIIKQMIGLLIRGNIKFIKKVYKINNQANVLLKEYEYEYLMLNNNLVNKNSVSVLNHCSISYYSNLNNRINETQRNNECIKQQIITNNQNIITNNQNIGNNQNTIKNNQNIGNNQIDKSNTKQEQINHIKTQYSNKGLQYINYKKIYEQNKRRIKIGTQKNKQERIRQNIQIKQLFNSQYIKNQLLNTKYYYADIVTISSLVIQYLMNQIYIPQKDNTQIKQTQFNIVTDTHVHFLLYVYHLYIKQFKSFKQQLVSILKYWINYNSYHLQRNNQNLQKNNDNLQKNKFHKTFKIDEDLQMFVYLRKFIQSQLYYGNGPKVLLLAQNYTNFLNQLYKNQTNRLNQQIIKSDKQNDNKNTNKIIKGSKLLQNYLLSFPNLWVSTFKTKATKQQNVQLISSQLLSEQIVKNYQYFVKQFQNIFNELINYWLNGQKQIKNYDKQTNNFSYRKHLIDQFKQKDMIKCLNGIKLVIYRLWIILETPKFMNQKNFNYSVNNSNTNLKNINDKSSIDKRKYNEKDIQNQYIKLSREYQKKQINILTYLSSDRISSPNEQIKMMRILILLKNLCSDNLLKQIDNKQLTQFLKQLFQNNISTCLNSNNQVLRRQIKYLIGQLISKLTSSNYVDQFDTLNQYFQPNQHKFINQHKGKRNNRGQWYQ